MTITDFFANDDSREDKHIVLSVDSGSMTLHCKSASTSTSLTYPTTDQSTHQNASRFITLGTEVAALTNFFKGDYYYLRVWDSTALNADEVETLYTHRAQIGWDAVVAEMSGSTSLTNYPIQNLQVLSNLHFLELYRSGHGFILDF